MGNTMNDSHKSNAEQKKKNRHKRVNIVIIPFTTNF